MTQLNLSAPDIKPQTDLEEDDVFSSLRVLGLATLAIGALTLGLYLGRELRFRYKFRHRTPSDFFSNAGDDLANAEYGMGI